MTEHTCGRVSSTPVSALADRAARYVLEYAGPRAVSLDPDGRVVVEPPHTAAESDIVGTYTRSLGILELTRRITEDLRHEVGVRQLRRPAGRRYVTGAQAKQARGSV